jgi:hypothetical protein
MLPDILDKSFLLLNLGYGRGFSHTILFIIFCYVISYLISKKNIIIANSLTVGNIFHLILDLPEVPLFYPFIDYSFLELEDPLYYWFQQLFTNPIVQITEILGLVGFFYLIINYKLFSFKKLSQFLVINNPKEESP